MTFDSESLKSADYDSAKQRLTVVFRHGGRYRYFAVPRRVFRELLAAESKGGFFTRHIRGHYRFRKLDGE